jgi:hypothetical protein
LYWILIRIQHPAALAFVQTRQTKATQVEGAALYQTCNLHMNF